MVMLSSFDSSKPITKYLDITSITCIDFTDMAIRHLYSLTNSFPFYVIMDLLFVIYARW